MGLTEYQKSRMIELSDMHLGDTPHGVALFNKHPPADTCTGLVIGRYFQKHNHKRLFKDTVYYILQWDTETYDYNHGEKL